jgi:transposase
MDARRQKAHELADRARITLNNGYYTVPSQSGGGSYTVVIDDRDALCDCPDFELRNKACKHIMAVRLLESRQLRDVEQDTESVTPSPKVKRPTYKQDWPNYNAAQVNEGQHFPELLADLCRGIPEPAHAGRGRKPVPLADQVFAATTKVYSLFSARRFMADVEDAHDRGFISRPMHFNSVLNALDNPALTPILHDLIRQSSLPLRAVETTFAPDSSGFCTSRFIRWFDVKYGVTREEAEWVKCHLITGVKTNVVAHVVILDKNANDSPQLPELVNVTAAQGFTVNEVCADKGYTSAENFDAVAAVGGTLYAPFKSNHTGAAGGLFEKMFYRFMYQREDYLKHYHQRSNVESTFSAIKRKFGDSVRSKSDTAMTNEVLCKVLAHNLCVLISAWYELGIEPMLGDRADGPQDVLRFRRPG